MFSYRHSFHAGNHADVLKHVVLSLILESLKTKGKPFIYHDTHAGAGCYDLLGDRAQRTGEYLDGIARLWRGEVPELLESYLSAVRQLNGDGELRAYPGSPEVARHLCRVQDRLHLTELNPLDFAPLQTLYCKDKRMKVFQVDAYQHLKASMPPQERRGLVLIDPPYELSNEYQQMVDGLLAAYKRWPTGTYAVWYPVVDRTQVKRVEQKLVQSGIRKILKLELCVQPDSPEYGMTGSGLWVINPPWKLAEQMTVLMPFLKSSLAQSDQTETVVEWLVPE